jgi:gliding motility-associated-like protein
MFNSITCSWDVTGTATPPTFVESLPTNVTVECSAIPIHAELTAIDVCGSSLIVNYHEVKNIGSCPIIYTLVRTWTAVDSFGLQINYTQTVTVQDTTPPQLAIATPYDSVVHTTCNNVPSVPQLQFTDCSNVSVVTNQTTSSVSPDGSYTITRTWFVSDECSNSQNYTQTIYVTITNFTQSTSVSSKCNGDIDLSVDLENLLDTQFTGVTTSNGTWTVSPSTTGLNTTTGIFTPYSLAVGNYVVTYNNNDSVCPSSVSITIPVDGSCIVEPCRELIIHNAVTPNGDTKNEYFDIENITDSCYSDNTVEIYNRWGVMVYNTTNYDNRTRLFTGVSEGRSTIKQSAELPTGTYFYILKYRNSEGNYTTKTGYLYLSR